MWTPENRPKYDRSKPRYPSDLTDEEWAIVAPLDPTREARRQHADGRWARGGRRGDVHPLHRLPVGGAAEGPAAAQHRGRLLAALGRRPHARPHPPRAPRAVPRAGGARGQPDGGGHRQPERRGRGKGGRRIDPSGFDAGKKVKGKKRHVPVDTQGLLMQAILHAAHVQDRDGGVLLMGSLFGLDPLRGSSPSCSSSTPTVDTRAPSSRPGCAPFAAR